MVSSHSEMIVRFLDRDYYGDRCEKEKERDEELIRHVIHQEYGDLFPKHTDGLIRRQFRHLMMETRIVDSPPIHGMESAETHHQRRTDA